VEKRRVTESPGPKKKNKKNFAKTNPTIRRSGKTKNRFREGSVSDRREVEN